MSVLSREDLRAALAADPPLVEDVDAELQLQPNGIDLRVAAIHRLTSRGSLGTEARDPAGRAEIACDTEGWWDLAPGAYVIAYREKVNLPPDLTALLRPRSSLLRSGATIHGAVWDAGYSGRGEGLLAVWGEGYRLQRGSRVAQIVFFRLSSATKAGYAGRYQGEGGT